MIQNLISKELFSQIKKFFQYGLGNIFAIFIPLIVSKKVLDICGAEQFGKVSIALSVCFILSIFIDFGSFVSPLKKISVNRCNIISLKKIFSVVFYSRIILFFFTLLIGFFLIFFIPFFQGNFKLYLFSYTIFLGQFFSPIWVFQGLEDFKSTAFFTAFSKVFYIILVFFFINYKEDYVYVNFLLGVSNVVVFLLANYFLFYKHKIILIKVSKKEILDYLKEDAHLLINNFSLASMSYAPIIFIGAFVGDFWAGIYKVLDVFITLLRNYLLLFFNSIYPKTCQLLSKSHAIGSKFILKYSIISSTLLFFIICFSVFFKSYFLSYFLKENAGLVSNYFNWIGVSILFASFNTPFLQVLFYYQKKFFYANIYLIVSIISVLLNYFLIKKFQIEGLIISLFITEFLLTFLFMISTEFLIKNISLIRKQRN